MRITHFVRLCGAVTASTFLLIACDSSNATSLVATPIAASAAATNGATRTHSEFDTHFDFNVYLSCIDEVTHWVTSGHTTIDVLRTPSGVTSTTIKGRANESEFYLVRANGVRYNMIAQGSAQAHQFDGPVSFVNIVEPKVFRSESGDVLVTNYHLRITFDADGNVIGVTANGACP